MGGWRGGWCRDINDFCPIRLAKNARSEAHPSLFRGGVFQPTRVAKWVRSEPIFFVYKRLDLGLVNKSSFTFINRSSRFFGRVCVLYLNNAFI